MKTDHERFDRCSDKMFLGDTDLIQLPESARLLQNRLEDVEKDVLHGVPDLTACSSTIPALS